MIVKSDCYIKKLVLNLLILFGLLIALSAQDKKIGGIINIYKHVTEITGIDNVTVEVDVTGIQAGDTVLLIQMKGIIINVPEGGSYGSYKDKINASGQSEFLIVESVNGGTKNIVFTNDILKTYDVFGTVQLVRVPYYNSATVISELTCQPWDSSGVAKNTGGVLAMIIGRTLALDANIDVTGKGFLGGSPFGGTGICIANVPLNPDNFSYPNGYMNSGFKGESPVSRAFLDLGNVPPYNPDYIKGKGANFTGGGGGNGRYSGGGGGSNYGIGGRGGREMSTCGPPGDGGLGGKTFRFTDADGGLFLGGGGGGSTYESANTATSGARGGGIIIILCDTIKGKGKIIKADGGTPSGAATGNAGAGGGGGGGSIAIYQQSYSDIVNSALVISANGGNGGNNAGIFGEGGGGGGGFILTNDISLPANVSKTIAGGPVGTRMGASSGTSGAAGDSRTTYTPALNGFLFNSIRSSVTGDQTDSVCEGIGIPIGFISGTTPVGGVAPYTFEWESSTTSESAGFVAAPGTNDQQNYTPPAVLTQTTWFRRKVTDSGPPVITDISKPVEVIFQPAITGNNIGIDATICYNQDPVALTGATPANGSVHDYYLYKWIQNTTNTNWTTSPSAAGTFSNSGYDPPSLTNTTYYQRVVTSGRCVSYSTSVTVTVLPSITGNVTTRPDSVICEGSLFNNLGASAPGGGDNSYTFLWEESEDLSTWDPAVNVNNGTGYIPDTSTFASIENRSYRRVVLSGPADVCRSNSSPIRLTRYHKIKNNTIGTPDLICSGSNPVPLSGSAPAQGSLVYSYEWQDSSKVSTWTTRNTGDFSFSPPALTDTTWYRRVVNSSKCINVSPKLRIDVHKPVINNDISILSGSSDTTICNEAVPHQLKGTIANGGTNILGDYAYLWLMSADNVTWIPVTVNGTGVMYDPLALTATTWYKRQVISGECTVISASTVKITVLPHITNNIIIPAQTVCYNTIPAPVTGPSLSGGNGAYTYFWEQSADGVTWTAAQGINNAPTGIYQPPALIVPMKYKRTVKSGDYDCCQNVSNVIDIGIHALPSGIISNNADTTICGGSEVLLKVRLTGASPWNVTYKDLLSSFEDTKAVTMNAGIITAVPVSPSDLNTYNYALAKITDNNGCIATSLTGTKKAIVYKVPVANAGPDIIICGPEITLTALPSSGTGTWFYPSAVIQTVISNPSIIVTIDSTFTGADISHNFVWEEINWQCRSKDSATVTFYQRVISINAGPDTVLYSFDNIIHMVAEEPARTWETGSWATITGTGIPDDTSDNNTIVTDLAEGFNTLMWTIENGPCKLEDLIDLTVNKIFIPEGFSPNNDNSNDLFIITGLDLQNQTIAELKIVNSAGAEVFSTSKTNQEWKDWDGKNFRGIELPEGTYYYLLKIVSKNNGQVFKKSGFVVLKRY